MKFKLLWLALLSVLSITAQKNNVSKTNQQHIIFTQQISETSEALKLFSQKFNLPKGVTFVKKTENSDRNGFVHEKFQQYYKGLKVEFGTVITHKKNGVVLSANGELYTNSNEVITPLLSNVKAFNNAVNYVGASNYLWEDAKQAKLFSYQKPTGELLFYPILSSKKFVLAYKFDIYATKPISRQEVYVDATTGTILFSNPIIKHADKINTFKGARTPTQTLENAISKSIVSGNANTRYSGTRTIETTLSGSNYVLRDATRGNGIFTFNCETNAAYQEVDFIDNDNNWTTAEYNNAAKDNGALDAHWGAERTYDFWSTVFGRNSFDNNGAAIRSFVHYDVGYNNAFWNGAVMTYGDGSGFDILTSIDVCGHEIGHAICTYTADLVYQNESGAMNEGFSDIWGACIEYYGRTGSLSGALPTQTWLIGEDISTNPLRSMSDPNSRNDPDTYLGDLYYVGTADSGGVHTNSGVLNHWFYILTQGASGTNNASFPDTYNVTGIGLAKAAEIAYLAERDYLTPNATFEDARNATIEVANLLYCANSPEAIAVTNAWFAVNVGEEFIAANDDIALQSVEGATTIPCSATSFATNLTLRNQGVNTISQATISYSVDGGPSVNSSWNGSILPCNQVSLPITVSGLSRGAHTITFTSTIVNDGRAENNVKSVNAYINDAGTVGVVNPFTTAATELISYNEAGSGPKWVRGTRTAGLTSSGNTVYATNLTEKYQDNVKTYLVSQCYNLSNVVNPQISFAMKFKLEEYWDVVYVEYSTNFGASWTVLGENGPTWYNSNRTPATSGADCYNCPGAQWTGTDTTLKTYTYPLTALSTESNVIFRIVFHSDEGVNDLGANIDDFVINGTLSSQDFELQSIVLYPNPSNGIFNLNAGLNKISSIDVYDVTGKIVWSKKDFEVSNAAIQLNLSAVSKGIYFVKIATEDKSTVKRIIIE